MGGIRVYGCFVRLLFLFQYRFTSQVWTFSCQGSFLGRAFLSYYQRYSRATYGARQDRYGLYFRDSFGVSYGMFVVSVHYGSQYCVYAKYSYSYYSMTGDYMSRDVSSRRCERVFSSYRASVLYDVYRVAYAIFCDGGVFGVDGFYGYYQYSYRVYL